MDQAKEEISKACHEFADFMAEEIIKLVEEHPAVMERISTSPQRLVLGSQLSKKADPYPKLVTKNVIDRMRSVLALVIATQRQEQRQLVEIIHELGLRKIKQELKKGGKQHV